MHKIRLCPEPYRILHRKAGDTRHEKNLQKLTRCKYCEGLHCCVPHKVLHEVILHGGTGELKAFQIAIVEEKVGDTPLLLPVNKGKTSSYPFLCLYCHIKVRNEQDLKRLIFRGPVSSSAKSHWFASLIDSSNPNSVQMENLKGYSKRTAAAISQEKSKIVYERRYTKRTKEDKVLPAASKEQGDKNMEYEQKLIAPVKKPKDNKTQDKALTGHEKKSKGKDLVRQKKETGGKGLGQRRETGGKGLGQRRETGGKDLGQRRETRGKGLVGMRIKTGRKDLVGKGIKTGGKDLVGKRNKKEDKELVGKKKNEDKELLGKRKGTESKDPVGKKKVTESKDLVGKRKETESKDHVGKRKETESKDHVGRKKEIESKDRIGKKKETENKDLAGKEKETEKKDLVGKKKETENKDLVGKKKETENKDLVGKKKETENKDHVGKKKETEGKDHVEKKKETESKDLVGNKRKREGKDLLGQSKKAMENENESGGKEAVTGTEIVNDDSIDDVHTSGRWFVKSSELRKVQLLDKRDEEEVATSDKPEEIENVEEESEVDVEFESESENEEDGEGENEADGRDENEADQEENYLGVEENEQYEEDNVDSEDTDSELIESDDLPSTNSGIEEQDPKLMGNFSMSSAENPQSGSLTSFLSATWTTAKRFMSSPGSAFSFGESSPSPKKIKLSSENLQDYGHDREEKRAGHGQRLYDIKPRSSLKRMQKRQVY